MAEIQELLQSTRSYKIYKTQKSINLVAINVKNTTQLQKTVSLLSGYHSIAEGHHQNGAFEMPLDYKVIHLNTDLPFTQRMNISLALLKSIRLFIRKRTNNTLPKPVVLMCNDQPKVAFIAMSNSRNAVGFLNKEASEDYVRALLKQTFKIINKMFGNLNWLEGHAESLDLNSIETHFEYMLFSYNLTKTIPELAMSTAMDSNITLARHRTTELSAILAFCKRINNGSNGLIRLSFNDRQESLDIRDSLHRLVSPIGLDIKELTEVTPLSVFSKPTLIYADNFQAEKVEDLLKRNVNVGLMLFDCDKSKPDFEVYGDLQFNYPTYPVVKFYAFSKIQVRQIVCAYLFREDNRAIQLADSIYTETLGHIAEIKLTLRVLIYNNSISFDKTRQFYEFENDIDLPYTQRLITQFRSLKKQDRTLLEALSVAPKPITTELAKKVSEPASDTDFQSSVARLENITLLVEESGYLSIEPYRFKKIIYAFLNIKTRKTYHHKYLKELNPTGDGLSVLYHTLNTQTNIDRWQLITSAVEKLGAYRATKNKHDLLLSEYIFKRTSLLIEEEDWLPRQETVISLLESGSKIAIALGKVDSLEWIHHQAKQHALSPQDRVNLTVDLIEGLMSAQRYDDAIDTGLDWLQDAGVTLPHTPTDQELYIEYCKTKLILLKSPWIRKGQYRYANDKSAIAKSRIMGHLGSVCYLSRPKLFPMLSFLCVQLAAKHGICPEHSIAFSVYAFFITALGHRKKNISSSLDRASRCLTIANAIHTEYDGHYSSRVCLVEHGFISNWRGDQLNAIDHLFSGYKEANIQHDYEYALYCAAIGACLQLTRGVPLNKMLSDIKMPFMQAKERDQISSVFIFSSLDQFAHQLKDTASQYTLPSAHPNLMGQWGLEIEKHKPNAQTDQTFACIYLLSRVFYDLIMDTPDAQPSTLLEEAARCIDGVQGQQLVVLFYFLDCWTLANSLNRKDNRKRYKANMKKFEHWLEISPINYEHYFLFLRALYAQKTDLNSKYEDDFFSAYRKATQNSHFHVAGVFGEHIARSLSLKGNNALARQYVEGAVSNFEKWGATGKVKKILTDFQYLYQNPVIYSSVEAEKANVIKRITGIVDESERSTCNHELRKKLLSTLASEHSLTSCSIFERRADNTVDIISYSPSESGSIQEKKLAYGNLSVKRKDALSYSATTHIFEDEVFCFYPLHTKEASVVLELVHDYANNIVDSPIFRLIALQLSQTTNAIIKDRQHSEHTSVEKRKVENLKAEKLKAEQISAEKNNTEKPSSEMPVSTLIETITRESQNSIKSILEMNQALFSLSKPNAFQLSLLNASESVANEAITRMKSIRDNKTLFDKNFENLTLVLVSETEIDSVDRDTIKATGINLIDARYDELTTTKLVDLQPNVVVWGNGSNTDVDLSTLKGAFSTPPHFIAWEGGKQIAKSLDLPLNTYASTVVEILSIIRYNSTSMSNLRRKSLRLVNPTQTTT